MHSTPTASAVRSVVAALLLLLSPLALLPAGALAAAAEEGGQPEEPAAGWVCPPCVHSDLDRVFPEPGRCPVCGMELVARSELVYVAILVFDGVQIIDYTGPYEVFGQAKLVPYTVSPDGAPISTAMDMRVTPHYAFADAPRPDVLLVPGGNVGEILDSREALDWVREAADGADHVLSVCNGAFILAEAGLLDGLRATTFHRLLADLAVDHPEVEVLVGARFVDNGKIVTSAGLSAGLDAALHVVAEIQGGEEARRLAEHLEYDWRSDSGVARARTLGLALEAGRLHDYDGVYEHDEGGPVTVAGSDADHRLYAFVGGERFPLPSLGQDRFLNGASEEVAFVRAEGEVVGYRLGTDDGSTLYRRLGPAGEIPGEPSPE